MTLKDYMLLSGILAVIAAFAAMLALESAKESQKMFRDQKLDTALVQIQDSIELEKKRLGDAVTVLDVVESPGVNATIEIKLQFLLSRIEILIQLQKMSPPGKNGDAPVPAPKPVKPTGSPSPTGSASIGSTAVISTSD